MKGRMSELFKRILRDADARAQLQLVMIGVKDYIVFDGKKYKIEISNRSAEKLKIAEEANA